MTAGTRAPRATLGAVAIVLTMVAAVIVAILMGARLQPRAESAIAGLAVGLPFGFAFGAGLVASVNPCGFFMLPSYVSFYLGSEEPEFNSTPTMVRLLHALGIGMVASGGFLAVLAPAALVVTGGGRWLAGTLPYAGFTVGVLVILLGGWIAVSGGDGPKFAARLRSSAPRRTLRSVFAFGAAYGVTSLGCSLPIFIAVVGTAAAAQSPLESLGRVTAYALGMGSVLLAVTLSTALLKGAVARWLRGLMPHVRRATALFLMASGAYLVYYWVFFADSVL